jgi:hypothetical protein
MKEGWAGIHVAPAMEFDACCEAQRLGLLAYCPQRRVRIWPKGVTEPLMRAYPLFKGYLLAPLSQARDRSWPFARGVQRPRWLATGSEGRPWAAPDEAIRELSELEREGAFDDPLPHNAARLSRRASYGARWRGVGGSVRANLPSAPCARGPEGDRSRAPRSRPAGSGPDAALGRCNPDPRVDCAGRA